ncbi:hypothetical protein B0H16DRAFT_1885983 [Mycena metata]|uniref:Uncharacterized protein n=1 Tax=Mycena metata TaxID=1033252 RepID=A0AAD7J3J1_9AGAR|nr:hypothetical protein B0H16DRAFT_1885983 [Mycena metata]
MPNPILKRARSDAAPHTVHFSPALTRTFTAHPRSEYDRSPIVVSPNACALPARGCPGRTYYDSAPRRSKHTQQQQPPRGHLHPRALQNYHDDDEDDEDDDEVERTPTRTSPYIALPVPPPIPQPPAPSSFAPYTTQPPPLVPDLSSESDESSDGFASPPPEPASNVPVFAGGKYPYPYALPYPTTSYPPPFSIPPSSLSLSAFNAPPYPTSAYPPYPYPQSQTAYPAPGSPPRAAAPTPRTRRPTMYVRSATPTQSQSQSHAHSYNGHGEDYGEDGYEEEDLPGSHTHAAAFSSSRASPPKARRTRSRERERGARASPGSEGMFGGRSTPTPGSPRFAGAVSSSPRSSTFPPSPSLPPTSTSTSSSSSKPRASSKSKSDKEKGKDGKERKEKKEKKSVAVAALCRSLKGASFRDTEGDGCLGGF